MEELTLSPPLKDLYVDSNVPAANFGQAQWLYVGTFNPSSPVTYRSLLRFDLAAVPADSTLLQATLRLRLARNDYRQNKASIDAHRLEAAFDERVTTWSNQPSCAAAAAASVTLREEVHTVVSWDITELVRDWLDGWLNHGLCLKAADESSLNLRGFNSKEAADASHWPALMLRLVSRERMYDRGFTSVAETLAAGPDSQFTSARDNRHLQNPTYFVINDGPGDAVCRVQVSPDGVHYLDDSADLLVPAASAAALVVSLTARYTRLAYRSTGGASLTLIVQAQV